MIDIMLDLETWGTSPRAAVRAIGMVIFDRHTTENIEILLIDARTSIDSQLECGREIEPDTVAFWRRQKLDISSGIAIARTEYLDAVTEARTLPRICKLINDLIALARELSSDGRITLWARGVLFDISILQDIYDRQGIESPWNYWEIADVRTLDHLVGKTRSARAHEPLADCFAQVQQVRNASRLTTPLYPTLKMPESALNKAAKL